VAAVLSMLDAQAHRGPDDWGLVLPRSLAHGGGLPVAARDPDHVRTYDDGGVRPGAVLGARRLSILDLTSRGRMPMGEGRGRIWVAHNGEIYNHGELRRELASAAAPFCSAADTEVILRGYDRWGDEVVTRLRGMFAFALFDATPARPRLVLARDRLGIKPLYYYRDGERLIWASEVRALLRSGLVPDEENPEALLRFLQLGSVPAPQTTVKGVMALEAGHWLTVEEAGPPEIRRFWDLTAFTPARGGRVNAPRHAEAVAQTRALLEDAVGLHLVGDVPLGVFLSGGIDSSALVALASQRRDRPLTTLSVGFDEPAYGEAAHARRVARQFKTDHREILLDARGFFDAVPGFFRAMDEPTVDGVNTYVVAAAARREGVTAVLSGTGGDEVFWGYRHLRHGAWLEGAGRVIEALPGGVRGALVRAARCAAGAVARGALDRLDYFERPSASGVYLTVRGLYGAGQVRDLLGIGAAELDAYGPPFAATGAPPARAAGHALGLDEFTHYLQDQLLKDTDVMSMAHSVEVRVPFLDHRLVEYVVGLPARIKLAGATPKPLLLAALGDVLPSETWDRPKMGFTLPFAPWLRRRAPELRAQSLEGGYLGRRAVERVWDGFEAGRLHWSRAWALVVLARFAAGRDKAAA
jgi:asparagine synthase (glutamine-hydrolysing)